MARECDRLLPAQPSVTTVLPTSGPRTKQFEPSRVHRITIQECIKAYLNADVKAAPHHKSPGSFQTAALSAHCLVRRSLPGEALSALEILLGEGMCTEGELHKSEYETLRQETNIHQTFANALIALELTALGTGISIGGKYIYVLAGLAIATSMLWLSYLDHLGGIIRVAAYIALVLRPRLSVVCGRPVLSWEVFLRRTREASEGLTPGACIPRERLREPTLGLTYVSIFFGATPPTLVTLYIYDFLRSHSQSSPVVWLIVTVSIMMWLFATMRAIYVARWMHEVDAVIKESGTRDRLSVERAGEVATSAAHREDNTTTAPSTVGVAGSD